MNDAATLVREVLAFEEAVAEGLAFARTDGETLVISTSDHETGGLTLGRHIDGVSTDAWKPHVLARPQRSIEHLIAAMAQRTAPSEPMQDALQWTEEQTGLNLQHDGAAAEILRSGHPHWRERLGLHLAHRLAQQARLGWTTQGHTSVDVSLYAYGPGWTHFLGNHDNTHIGSGVAALLGFDLASLDPHVPQTARTQTLFRTSSFG